MASLDLDFQKDYNDYSRDLGFNVGIFEFTLGMLKTLQLELEFSTSIYFSRGFLSSVFLQYWVLP